MSKTITIDEDKFIDILSSTSAKFCMTELEGMMFDIFCGEVHKALFGDDEDTKAPFKVGDKVFVIDNEGDGNIFVNRVVTVNKAYDDIYDDSCIVTDGECEQTINFKNLRKVVN